MISVSHQNLAPVSDRFLMSQPQDDVEHLRESLAELRTDASSSFMPMQVPVVTHTAEAKSGPRPKRLGLETLTHAPLNFRVFPETPYSIDEFRIHTGKKSSLGKGAMGNVLLARWIAHPDKPLRALKRISKFQMWKDDHPIVLFEQLWDEIEALLTLKHENIIGLDGYFEDYKYVYLIMEYAPNGDLNHLLESQNRLSESETARHIESLIRALLYCHNHNYLHRDIKPENLLISSKGELLLADFGCVATRHSTKKSLCGTRYYHSYEIANEEAHDAASDAWSVGVVAFELLSGKSPFESNDESDQDDDAETDSTESEPLDLGSEDGSDLESDQNDSEDENSNCDSHEIYCSDASTEIDDDENGSFNEDGAETASRRETDHIGEKSASSTRSFDSRENSRRSNSPENQIIGNDGDGNNASSNDDDDRAVVQLQLEDGSDDGGNDDESSNASSEDSENVEIIYDRIRNLDYRFPDLFSDVAKDFVSRLLEKDKERRMTLFEALNHPFIKQLHRLDNNTG